MMVVLQASMTFQVSFPPAHLFSRLHVNWLSLYSSALELIPGGGKPRQHQLQQGLVKLTPVHAKVPRVELDPRVDVQPMRGEEPVDEVGIEGVFVVVFVVVIIVGGVVIGVVTVIIRVGVIVFVRVLVGGVVEVLVVDCAVSVSSC